MCDFVGRVGVGKASRQGAFLHPKLQSCTGCTLSNNQGGRAGGGGMHVPTTDTRCCCRQHTPVLRRACGDMDSAPGRWG